MSLYPMTLKKYCEEIEGYSDLSRRLKTSRQNLHKRAKLGWIVDKLGKHTYLYNPKALFKL